MQFGQTQHSKGFLLQSHYIRIEMLRAVLLETDVFSYNRTILELKSTLKG